MPGDGTAMVTDRGIALVLAGIETAACLMIDAALQSAVGLDRMMTSLSSLGFDALPDMAIAVAVADGVQLLHRGDVSLEIEKNDGDIERFVSPKVTTWREEFVPGATLVRFYGPGTAGRESHRLSAGVVPARQISWPVPSDKAAAADVAVATIADEAVLTPADEPVSTVIVDELISAVAEADDDQPNESLIGTTSGQLGLPQLPPLATVPLPTVLPDVPAMAPALPSLPSFAAPSLPILPPMTAPARGPSSQQAAVVPSEADDLDFSNLVSHTVFRHVEDAAIRETEHDEPLDPKPEAKAKASTKPNGQSADGGNVTIMPEWTKPPESDGPHLISGVPQPPSPMAPASQGDQGDHDGKTVARPRKKPTPVQTPISAINVLQPMIQAVRCIGGHFNAPNAHQCRICSDAIIDRTQISTHRPALGVLRFSTNETVSVAGPILIGRNPPNGLAVDGETAAVVAIDNGELSRFHAAIHLTEWYVHVADQASMNGTMVTAPGKPRQTLRPYEKVQISPGTVVELGGAVSFRFDAS